MHKLWTVLSMQQPRTEPVPPGHALYPQASSAGVWWPLEGPEPLSKGIEGRGVEGKSSCSSWPVLLPIAALLPSFHGCSKAGSFQWSLYPLHFLRITKPLGAGAVRRGPLFAITSRRAWFCFDGIFFILSREVCHNKLP